MSADEDVLRAMRAARPALQEYWPDGERPSSWIGVKWSDNRVQGLNLKGSGLEVLARCGTFHLSPKKNAGRHLFLARVVLSPWGFTGSSLPKEPFHKFWRNRVF